VTYRGGPDTAPIEVSEWRGSRAHGLLSGSAPAYHSSGSGVLLDGGWSPSGGAISKPSSAKNGRAAGKITTRVTCRSRVSTDSTTRRTSPFIYSGVACARAAGRDDTRRATSSKPVTLSDSGKAARSVLASSTLRRLSASSMSPHSNIWPSRRCASASWSGARRLRRGWASRGDGAVRHVLARRRQAKGRGASRRPFMATGGRGRSDYSYNLTTRPECPTICRR